MTDLVPLVPRQRAPDLVVDLVGGGTWRLADQKSEHFTLLNFYRGRHCPQCQRQLQEMNRKHEEFARRGVGLLALSCDTRERAEDATKEWGLDKFPVGYGLSLTEARRWGLYISTSRGVTSAGIEEPALFSEPGLFLVKPDGTLYGSIVQTMPFVRLHFNELIGALDSSIIPKNYPARGHVADLGDALAQQAAE